MRCIACGETELPLDAAGWCHRCRRAPHTPPQADTRTADEGTTP